MCLNACFLSGTCLRCRWGRIWPADASRVATPALLFWSLISSSVSYADSDCVCYSFSRLLTHYNWFFWHNFPNHSYISQNKDTFLETFNTFHLFALTLQFAQCFLQNSTQKHHHFAQIQPCSHSENTNTQYNYLKNHKMNTNSTHLSMCEHSVAQLKTHRSGSQDMHRSTSDYVFWKINPDSRRQRGIGGEKKNEGNEVKGHLLLMKYNKTLELTMFLCMDWPRGKLPAGSSTYTSHLQYKVAVFQMRGLLLFFVL